jgi:hypothetical protein
MKEKNGVGKKSGVAIDVYKIFFKLTRYFAVKLLRTYSFNITIMREFKNSK